METERYQVNPAKVVHETIEGEAILIQLESGFYYSLDGAGAEIWALLAESRSLGETARALERRYAAPPETLAAEVRRLADELAGEDLLERAGAAPPPPPPEPAANGAAPRELVPPVLRRYEDMQDFLLVDPIHEVGEGGWPDAQVRG